MNFDSTRKITILTLLLFFIILTDTYSKSIKDIKNIDSFPLLMQSIQFQNDIVYCSKKIPIHLQDVKARLEKEMLLALWDRPQVILWMKRSGKYFSHIEKILKKHDLPEDLKYVPIIESALRPHAGSHKGAVGYWQFIKSTGRRYGLRIDSQVDERKNIFRSTEAACRYLKDLKKQFGSYFLALAAYNMGEYGLKGEIEAQNNDNFFSLYLPLETQRYVFKLICAKLILENPSVYGFEFKKSDMYPAFNFDQVKFKTDFQIPIVLVATAANTQFKVIKDMNPELRGYYLTKGNTIILIPKGSAKSFKQKFTAQYDTWKKKYKLRIHIVKKGENLSYIAKKYNLSLSALLKLNRFSLRKIIHPGDRLIIE